MQVKSVLKKAKDNPYLILFEIIKRIKLSEKINDRDYIRFEYKAFTGKKLDLEHPRTYNEKIQWLKLYDRNPKYTIMVDKYAVRKFVADTIGEKYLIPLAGGPWSGVEEIDIEKLPEKFVLKCTHDSGNVFICNDREKFDWKKCKQRLAKGLKRNYYYNSREWPYKEVKPQIIAEQYMVDESGYKLKDYKIFCFNGEPKMIQVDYGRFTKHMRNLYTPEWEYIPAQIKYPTDASHHIPKPACLDEMLELARKLSKHIIHVRVDLYCIGNQIFFGEMTFHHGAGTEKFTPDEFEYTVGKWMNLEGENNKDVKPSSDRI